MTLDYTLEKPEERVALVNKILEENPNPSPKYLEVLGDYLIYCLTKAERKEKKLLTENRKVTIDKRETSYEGLVAQLENGEDGIYNLSDEGNKNVIFKPKVSITEKDLEEIPPLRQIREAIQGWQETLKKATGKDIYVIKQAIIDLRKDQYLVKDFYQQPIQFKNYTKSQNYIQLPETTNSFNDKGFPIPEGVSLMDPKICSIILCNYDELRLHSEGKFNEDTWYLLHDFDTYYERALYEYPIYKKIVEYKQAQVSNQDIQDYLLQEFGVSHSIEYISSLWRNKIPKLIASAAEDAYLDWYYLEIEKGQYKKCSKCGEIKLAHNKYFSRNKTSKDGFYSICKKCRNIKNKEEE